MKKYRIVLKSDSEYYYVQSESPFCFLANNFIFWNPESIHKTLEEAEAWVKKKKIEVPEVTETVIKYL